MLFENTSIRSDEYLQHHSAADSAGDNDQVDSLSAEHLNSELLIHPLVEERIIFDARTQHQ